MIFVTVGTTYFDELIEAMDLLKGSGKIKDVVVAQIGSGRYIPHHLEYFRYAPSLDEYYREADLVVTHAAAGTLFTLLSMKKKIVAVTNPRLKVLLKRDKIKVVTESRGLVEIKNRQEELPLKLEEMGYLVWCPDVKDLEDAINRALQKEFREYVSPECFIRDEIEKRLGVRLREEIDQ